MQWSLYFKIFQPLFQNVVLNVFTQYQFTWHLFNILPFYCPLSRATRDTTALGCKKAVGFWKNIFNNGDTDWTSVFNFKESMLKVLELFCKKSYTQIL